MKNEFDDIDYNDLLLDEVPNTTIPKAENIFNELNQNNIEILNNNLETNTPIDDDFLDINNNTNPYSNNLEGEVIDDDFLDDGSVHLYKMTDEISSNLEEDELETVKEDEYKSLVSELNKEISFIDDDLDILSQREAQIMEELEQKEKMRNKQLNEDETKDIEEEAKKMMEDYSSSEEELLKTLTPEEIEELVRLSPEIKKRDKSKRTYLKTENGEIVYENDSSYNVNKKDELVKNINKIKNKGKQGSKNLKENFNETIDNPQKRTRLLYVTLFLFLALFIGMFAVILNGINNQPYISNETIEKDTNTSANTIETSTDDIDNVLVENLVNNDIDKLNNDYVIKLKELNKEDIVNTNKYLDNKMNRISYGNKLKKSLTTKKNHLVTIESNQKYFKTEKELEVYNNLHYLIEQSVLYTNDLILLLDDGMSIDSVNNIVNVYYSTNIF